MIMAGINWESIHAKSRKAIEKKAKQKSKELGRTMAIDAANSFCKVLRNEINSCGTIDIDGYRALSNISHGEPYVSETTPTAYVYTVEVDFEGDMHRPSLAPEKYPEGAYNIASLINNGYHAAHTVSGVWEGHPGRSFSLKDRPPAHFAQNAVRVFMSGYATKYHVVDVRMSGIYN